MHTNTHYNLDMLLIGNFLVTWAVSHEAIYWQPVPGNLQEEKPFPFEC